MLDVLGYLAEKGGSLGRDPGAVAVVVVVAVAARPHRSAKSTKNGPPETDLANSIAGRGVPKKDHFLDLTQIRQLTQSDSIILILYVDDKKKPQNGLLKASRPPPCGCCLVISTQPRGNLSIISTHNYNIDPTCLSAKQSFEPSKQWRRYSAGLR